MIVVDTTLDHENAWVNTHHLGWKSESERVAC